MVVQWCPCSRAKTSAKQLYYTGERPRQAYAEQITLSHLEYAPGTRLGVWAEVKLKYEEAQKSFDYTFDYIIAPIGSIRLDDLATTLGLTAKTLTRNVQAAGYTLASRSGDTFVDDFPIGSPSLVEIMTSSTSGGNKATRTTVALAFEDAMLLREHTAPGINYRQVWARMVSQLIVKSEVAIAWGGKTIWVVQDKLVDYICKSTALNIRSFFSDHLDEVNMLSFGYGDMHGKTAGVLDLVDATLYAGPISASPQNDTPSFQDMIRTPLKPTKERLFALLAKQRPMNIIYSPEASATAA